MKNNYIGELIVSIILIVLLVFMVNPLDFWMPQQAPMMMVVAVGILFMIFASFVWREKVEDERDAFHRSIATRFAYLTGTGLLVVGIIWQSLLHVLDAWLIIVLGAMILAKIIGRLYSKMRY